MSRLRELERLAQLAHRAEAARVQQLYARINDLAGQRAELESRAAEAVAAEARDPAFARHAAAYRGWISAARHALFRQEARVRVELEAQIGALAEAFGRETALSRLAEAESAQSRGRRQRRWEEDISRARPAAVDRE